jgi:quercetin dioxygenase-like cupin family protein
VETLRNSKTGETIHVLESIREVFRLEFSLHPHAAIPGSHIPPQSEQRISVRAGKLQLRIAGRHHVVGPGETLWP